MPHHNSVNRRAIAGDKRMSPMTPPSSGDWITLAEDFRDLDDTVGQISTTDLNKEYRSVAAMAARRCARAQLATAVLSEAVAQSGRFRRKRTMPRTDDPSPTIGGTPAGKWWCRTWDHVVSHLINEHPERCREPNVWFDNAELKDGVMSMTIAPGDDLAPLIRSSIRASEDACRLIAKKPANQGAQKVPPSLANRQRFLVQRAKPPCITPLPPTCRCLLKSARLYGCIHPSLSRQGSGWTRSSVSMHAWLGNGRS